MIAVFTVFVSYRIFMHKCTHVIASHCLHFRTITVKPLMSVVLHEKFTHCVY